MDRRTVRLPPDRVLHGVPDVAGDLGDRVYATVRWRSMASSPSSIDRPIPLRPMARRSMTSPNGPVARTRDAVQGSPVRTTSRMARRDGEKRPRVARRILLRGRGGRLELAGGRSEAVCYDTSPLVPGLSSALHKVHHIRPWPAPVPRWAAQPAVAEATSAPTAAPAQFPGDKASTRTATRRPRRWSAAAAGDPHEERARVGHSRSSAIPNEPTRAGLVMSGDPVSSQTVNGPSLTSSTAVFYTAGRDPSPRRGRRRSRCWRSTREKAVRGLGQGRLDEAAPAARPCRHRA